jgi:Lhr-like helicase
MDERVEKRELLKLRVAAVFKAMGYDSLRDGQLDAACTILEERFTFLVRPTGSGKTFPSVAMTEHEEHSFIWF